MNAAITQFAGSEIEVIRESGLFKDERVIQSSQNAHIAVPLRPDVINLCANNYLGLADYPEVKEAAKAAIDRWGFGLASVRFICGTQEIHKELEARISAFQGTEDTILYPSCFDANGGLFEVLLGPDDAIISDASIIDGIRLCKARRFRYANNDMEDLEAKLQEAGTEGKRLVATDGVFSMDGTIADLKGIAELAEKYAAGVMFDDCHAVGFLGAGGRGTHAFRGLPGSDFIITGTLGKALGGASGGYTSGPKEVIGLLRQRSRPYLFSNTVAPAIVAASLKVLDLVESDGLRDKLWENTRYFRAAMVEAGFDIVPGEHPIVPVMLGDSRVAKERPPFLPSPILSRAPSSAPQKK